MCGVIVLYTLDPPQGEIPLGRLISKSLRSQSFFFSQKSSHTGVDKGGLTTCLGVVFGSLHQLTDQGVGWVHSFCFHQQQTQAGTQQGIDRRRGCTVDQQVAYGLGGAPMPQHREQQSLCARAQRRGDLRQGLAVVTPI